MTEAHASIVLFSSECNTFSNSCGLPRRSSSKGYSLILGGFGMMVTSSFTRDVQFFRDANGY